MLVVVVEGGKVGKRRRGKGDGIIGIGRTRVSTRAIGRQSWQIACDLKTVSSPSQVKRTTKFARIMNAFCERKAWDPKQVRFVFEGQRISAESTPEDHDMEEGDCLDAVLEQIGGWQ